MPQCPASCKKTVCPVKGACNVLENKPIVWVLGGPGSGKGTQCEKIADKYGFAQFSTGYLLWEEVNSGSERGNKLLTLLGEGQQVPNGVVLELLKEAMLKKAPSSKGFLIDGYPRDQEQAAAFEKSISPVTTIIYFEAPDDTLTKRCLDRGAISGWIDDNADAIKRRLESFHENKIALLSRYSDKVVKINAERDTKEIFEDVQKVLDPIVAGQEKGISNAIGKKPIVWVLGGPGSGKGTQCEKIVAKYGFTHLSTDDLLRKEVDSGSERGKKLQATMERGELVPNEIVLDLLKEAMVTKAPTSKGFLIDGYPREQKQGAAFEKNIAPVTTILYFEVSDGTLMKRCLDRGKTSGGRSDDNADTIKNRLKLFHKNNSAVLSQYPHKVIKINAERNPDEIFVDVQKILDPIMVGQTTGIGSAIEKKPIVWVLGGPGSGKGTQCEKIVNKYGFTHLSTGDLLREEVKSGSQRAKKLLAIMEKGELVPNEIVVDLLKEAMLKKASSSKGFLIDGYPREQRQGAEFEKSIAPVTMILYFEVSDKMLMKRCLDRGKTSGGRSDDNADTIKHRLKIFHKNNSAVLSQYPHKLVKINAERDPEEIFVDVQKVLDPIVADQAAVPIVNRGNLAQGQGQIYASDSSGVARVNA